jgi:hypothetical protein
MADTPIQVTLLCNQAQENNSLYILQRVIELLDSQGDDGGWALALFGEEIRRLIKESQQLRGTNG